MENTIGYESLMNTISFDSDVSSIANLIITNNLNIMTGATITGFPVDGSSIDFNTSDLLEVKDNGITASKISNNAVTTNKIADGNVTASKLAVGAITSSIVTVNSDWIPNNNDAYDLGSSSFRWRDIYKTGVDYDLIYILSNKLEKLGIGTSGQVLGVSGGGALSWVSPSVFSSPLTTKGDIFTYSTTDARLPVGANNSILYANSSTTTGLEWTDKILLDTINTDTDTLNISSGTGINYAGLSVSGSASDINLQILPKGAGVIYTDHEMRSKGIYYNGPIRVQGVNDVTIQSLSDDVIIDATNLQTTAIIPASNNTHSIGTTINYYANIIGNSIRGMTELLTDQYLSFTNATGNIIRCAGNTLMSLEYALGSNYLRFVGSTTPIITVAGPDSNIDLLISGKGASSKVNLSFGIETNQTTSTVNSTTTNINSTTTNIQNTINLASNQTHYLQVTGSGTAGQITATSVNSNSTIQLRPKGTGVVSVVDTGGNLRPIQARPHYSHYIRTVSISNGGTYDITPANLCTTNGTVWIHLAPTDTFQWSASCILRCWFPVFSNLNTLYITAGISWTIVGNNLRLTNSTGSARAFDIVSCVLNFPI